MSDFDLNLQPDGQIRDQSYPLDTPSLTTLGAEPVPEEIIQALFRREWIATQVAPIPQILIKDEVNQAQGEQIIISVENYQEIFNGHRHEFVDLEVSMQLEIKSFQSRMAMWAMMGETRRIVYRWILALRPYQSLYWDGFQPEYMGPGNYKGVARIRLTAAAIPAFLRHTGGATLPSTEPDLSDAV